MDPLNEQRLRDEVIYLHSLWHQGPPRPTRNANAAPAVHHQLQPSKATKFKKQKKRRGKSGKESSDAEWPCPASPPPPSTTGWPPFALNPNPQPTPLSPEEQSKLDAKYAHKKAIKVVREFFIGNRADDCDAIDSASDEDGSMEADFGREEDSFFLKVFKDVSELREYYEKNFTKGEFSCLVCGALRGKGSTKKFKGCLPLVQHSITIANTKKRRAHRAFGQAVSKVLGWDIDHLPAIVSMLSEKPGEELGNGSIDNKESSTTLVNNADSVKNATLDGKTEEGVPALNGDERDINSLTCADADKQLENLGVVHGDNMKEPVAQGLIVSPLTCANADKNEDNGTLYQHNVEQPVPQGLTITSLTRTRADRSYENLGVVHPCNIEDTASECLRNVPLNNNNRVGSDVPDLQTG